MHFLATQNWRPLAINCPLSKDGRSQIPSVSVGAEPTLTCSLFLGGAWCKRKVWIEKGMNWSCSVRGNWLAGVVKSELMLFCGLTSQLPSGCTVCLTLPRRSVKRGAPASSQSAPQTCPPATALCQCPIMYFSSKSFLGQISCMAEDKRPSLECRVRMWKLLLLNSAFSTHTSCVTQRRLNWGKLGEKGCAARTTGYQLS